VGTKSLNVAPDATATLVGDWLMFDTLGINPAAVAAASAMARSADVVIAPGD
jgi:hypothetical protein